jgi:5'(3')-deoxyribonucleotidase
MAKPIIAVDIDDVLVPHFQDLIDWYNKKYGTHLTLAHNQKGDPKPWGVKTVEEAIKRVQGFFETPEFANPAPFKEAVAALKKLSQRYTLVVVTARDTLTEKITRDWLDKHFAKIFKEAHFTARYNLEGKARSKADVCQAVGAKYLIDDTPRNIIEAAEAGINCLLFGDYPWSKSMSLPANVIEVRNWDEVLEYF